VTTECVREVILKAFQVALLRGKKLERNPDYLGVVWRDTTLSISPDLFLAGNCLRQHCLRHNLPSELPRVGRLKQGRNLLQDQKHAHAGIDGGVDLVMVRSGVHHQDLRSLVSLLHHVGQVMTVIL
jgi:hypothetical protein